MKEHARRMVRLPPKVQEKVASGVAGPQASSGFSGDEDGLSRIWADWNRLRRLRARGSLVTTAETAAPQAALESGTGGPVEH